MNAERKKTGKGVRVVLIDSGVNPHHSHVERVAGGVRFYRDGAGLIRQSGDFRDLMGHGTALAGIVRARAPEAELYAVRVFERRLTTFFPVLEAALLWALELGAKIVNLSLGTSNPDHRERLQQLVAQARTCGALFVASAPPGGKEWLPASLPGVLGVAGDERCGWEEHRWVPGDPIPFRAHPCPRPLPGPAQRHNFRGHSFASAHLSAKLALGAEGNPLFGYEEAWAFLVETAIRT